MENNENYHQRFENLSKEVDNITESPSKNTFFMNNFLKKINTKYLIIICIPIVLIIIFISIKSSFVTRKDIENPDKKKLDFVKIIISFIILILLTICGMYIYNYKK